MDPLALQTTMDVIHPFYDTANDEWVVEVDGQEVTAQRLADLQSKLPDARIEGYYPEGYVAQRDGFLQPVGRYLRYVPQYSKPVQVDFKRRRRGPKLPKHVIEEAVATHKAIPDYEQVLNLIAEGLDSKQIAQQLNCTITQVHLYRGEAYKVKDERIKYKRRINKKNELCVGWKPEEIVVLRELVEMGLTSSQIGVKLNRSRNSIIGKCHRLSLTLKNIKNNKFGKWS
jgi:hypothetical protein